MTNTINIPGADGAVMVPVVRENGELMAYLLYPDPTGMVQVFSSWTTTPVQYHYHSTTTPLQDDAGDGTDREHSACYSGVYSSQIKSLIVGPANHFLTI